MFNTDPDTDVGGLTPRKKFAMPALPMPVMDADPSSNPLRGIEQPQPDGPPNPFEKALAMGTALGNTPPPDSGVMPGKPKLGAPPAATDSPAPKLGAAPTTSPDGSAAVAQGTPKLGASSSNAQEIPTQPGITRKPFFSTAERGIKNPVLRTLAEIGDVAGSTLLPGITNNIPGTRAAEMLADKRGLGQDKERAETGYRNAETDKLTKGEWTVIPGVTDANGSPIEHNKTTGEVRAQQGVKEQPLKPPNEWAALPGVVDADGNPVEINKTTGETRAAKGAGQVSPLKPSPETKLNDFEQYYKDYITENHLPDSAHNRLLARKEYAAAGQAPQHDQRQLAVGPDGTVIELKPGMKVPQGSKTMSGDLTGPKVSADEQKRADLVENLNENLDQLEDIVTRRPELFGSVAGRWTKMKEYIGSDDKDIAALKGIEDRLGMVQQSSHGMRSAQHVAASADSILNGFKNGPEAMKRAIADARKSGATFTADAQRGKGSGEAWSAPKDAPAAPKEDGHQLKKGGKTIAVSKGGQWAQPPQQ